MAHVSQLKLQELASTSQSLGTSRALKDKLWDAAAVASARNFRQDQMDSDSDVCFADMEMLIAAGSMSDMMERQTAIDLRQAVAEVLACWAAARDSRDSGVKQISFNERAGAGQLPEEPCVLRAQSRLCVLWKPPGWSVVVGRDDFDSSAEAPRRTDTDQMEGLDSMDQDMSSWLVRTFGKTNAIVLDAKRSHGLVHRLDKMTSGGLLWASNYSGYYAARLAFAARETLRKEYVCLSEGLIKRSPHLIAVALRRLAEGTDTRRSVAVAADAVGGRESSTMILDASHCMTPEESCASFVRVQIFTGRQHQIRAHLAESGHALLEDTAYGGSAVAWCQRIFLHSSHLEIDIGDGSLEADVPLPADLQSAVAFLRALDGPSRVALRRSQTGHSRTARNDRKTQKRCLAGACIQC